MEDSGLNLFRDLDSMKFYSRLCIEQNEKYFLSLKALFRIPSLKNISKCIFSRII